MAKPFTIPRLRWFIAMLLLAVTVINYTDRLTLSVLVGDVRQSLHLSETDYSQITSLFMAAYAIMYAVSGHVVDRLGTRWGMALFVCLWSVCQMLHGLAGGKWSFTACRIGLGLAEPGSFPAAVKAIREWFPASQRALGVGIFNTGSSLGAAAAAPVAAFLALKYDWRVAFIFTGALGLVWLVFWLMLYQPPGQNRWLHPAEAAELRAAGVMAPAQKLPPGKWSEALGNRACWTLMFVRFLADPVAYFFIFWFPAYLAKERGFDLGKIGQSAWVPYVFGGVGYLFGGWLSGYFLRAGWSLGKSRKVAMAIGAALLPVAILAPLCPSANLAIAATSIVIFGNGIWVANLLTLPADLFSPNQVGTVSGFAGMGGAMGGAFANLATGYVVAHYSYLPAFIWAGVMHPLALIFVWRFLPGKLFEPASAPANAALTNAVSNAA